MGELEISSESESNFFVGLSSMTMGTSGVGEEGSGEWHRRRSSSSVVTSMILREYVSLGGEGEWLGEGESRGSLCPLGGEGDSTRRVGGALRRVRGFR